MCSVLSIIFIQLLLLVQFQYNGRPKSFRRRFNGSENDDGFMIYSGLGLGVIFFSSTVDSLSSDRGSNGASS